jgi:hypothetical protein
MWIASLRTTIWLVCRYLTELGRQWFIDMSLVCRSWWRITWMGLCFLMQPSLQINLKFRIFFLSRNQLHWHRSRNYSYHSLVHQSWSTSPIHFKFHPNLSKYIHIHWRKPWMIVMTIVSGLIGKKTGDKLWENSSWAMLISKRWNNHVLLHSNRDISMGPTQKLRRRMKQS